MRIGELAREAGVGVETVRFYERGGCSKSLLETPCTAFGRCSNSGRAGPEGPVPLRPPCVHLYPWSSQELIDERQRRE